MKIYTSSALAPLGQAQTKPALAVSGFHLPVPREAASTRAASPLRAASSLGLIATIAEEDGRQGRQRKRQAHAGVLLDRLEDLARGLALGHVESDRVENLAVALSSAPETSDDPALEALVEAIELRVAVEIAKIKARNARF